MKVKESESVDTLLNSFKILSLRNQNKLKVQVFVFAFLNFFVVII